MAKALSAQTYEQIDKLLDMGHGPRAIAGMLCLHRTTIQRRKRKRKVAASPPFEYLTDAVDFNTLPRPVLRAGEVQARALGAAKYGDFNWKPEPDINRRGSRARHLMKVALTGIALGVVASIILAVINTP